MTFTLVSLNIEQRKHLDRVVPFLLRERPDVICLQEVFEDTVNELKVALEYEAVFAPRVRYTHLEGQEGIAILSRYPIVNCQFDSYDQFTQIQPGLESILQHRPDASLLTAAIDCSGTTATVGTTHFTWTPGGLVSDEQRVNVEHLIQCVEKYSELVLCGDFNAPRGLEIFDRLASVLKDNIPMSVVTTVDPELHRVKGLELVVDGLFTTSEYSVEDVTIRSGLSDHCAITAAIRR